MIDDLIASKSAAFFVVQKKLADRTIEGLFTTLRANYDVTTHNVFKHTREVNGTSHWSAVSFMYDSVPAFLDPTTDIRETLCGYLMLVEYDGYAAVFSSRISLPASFKSQHLAPVEASRVEGAIAKGNAVFQKMRMRNMSVSPYAMRNKTLEAQDLANVVGPGGSSRYAPQTYTVTADGIHSTATPSTGRIGIRSDKVGLLELVEFAEGVIDSLREDAVDVSPFIRSFARPVSLTEALAASQPTTMAVDTSRLIDAVTGDEATIRLVHGGENPVELTTGEFGDLIQQLDQALEIKGDGNLRLAFLPNSDDEAASISLNKNRVALRTLALPPASDVEVESLEFLLGTDPDRRSLQHYLDEANSFIVLFDDVRLAYIDGQVFRDESMLDGGASFLRYLHSAPSLMAVTSEKGGFAAGQAAFDASSTFGAIVNHIGAADTLLICDDLGDEWADFIGIKEDAGLTQITFYHAKHGALSLGASAFHVSVSQAIKNLGNMWLPEERMEGKTQGWANHYNAPDQVTLIPRTIRPHGANLLEVVTRARTAPDAIRRATIVTSSLSKEAVADAFAAIQAGQKPTPSFVQLYQLLQSFFGACTEVGATGSIVCQP